MKKRVFIAALFFMCASIVFSGNLDSLLKVLASHPKKDTARVLILNDLSEKYQTIGDMEKAIWYGNEANKLSDSLHYKYGIQASFNNLGNTYIDKGDIKSALEYHLKALKMREQMGERRKVGYSYLNLGNIYFRLNEPDNSLKYYFLSLEILKEMHDTSGTAICMSNIGSIYSNKLMPAKAEEYYKQSLEIRYRLGDKEGISQIYSNLSIVFMDAGKYKEALDYSFKTLAICNELGNKLTKTIALSNIGDIYFHVHEYNKAIYYQIQAFQLAKQMGSLYMLPTCCQLLSDAYKAKGDYKNGLLYFELFSQLRDSTMSTENTKNIAEMQTRFETGKKQKEIELLNKDKNIRELQLSEQQANIRRQRILIYSVVGGLALIVALILFIMKSYREKKKINIGLERKNIEINRQKNQIQEKNILITDSIDYARNIQNAILPRKEVIEKYIPKSFTLFLPKDVVSGDFYWLSPLRSPKANVSPMGENNNSSEGVLIAAVDCTGHGVPGAFMSVMAFNMLEDIVVGKKLTQPSLILDALNKAVIETLHQDTENTSTKYGMDIGLISLNKKINKLEFAGAHNSLLIIRAKESFSPVGEMPKAEGAIETEKIIIEVKANKTTIGMAKEKFSNHQIDVQKGDMLYMFTDGYADQKGGPENKKFYSATLKELLTSISDKNCDEQKNILEKTFNSWKNNAEQIDDVLIMGIRV